MKILFPLLLLALCTIVLCQTPDTTVTTDSTTIVTESTTTEGTRTTTESVSTTTVLSTPSPPETTTSSLVPETTTSSLVPETTTTVAPTTTRQPVTTIPPVTTAFPNPEKCSWNVTSRDNEVCIRAEMKVQFVIPNEGRKYYINLGCGARSVESDCSSNDTQVLVLVEPNQYNLKMVFEKKDAKFFVSNITFDYVLPNGENGSVANNKENFNVKLGHSYLCRSETPVHLENVTMEISEIQIEAFTAKGQENFGSAEECDADDKVSDVVPIAVGVALAALIIIVLIAYLVGRRRSRQRGYQSV